MADSKRILVLTADAGFGHGSAANAVAAALQETHDDDGAVEIVNPLDDKRVPAFLRKSQADYDRIVRDMPDLYKIGYEASYHQLTQMEWNGISPRTFTSS